MQKLPSRYALCGRYVFSPDCPPRSDEWLTVCDGRIESVGVEPTDCSQAVLGNVALLPGLINAHAHLEFSDLERPLGRPGISLCDWIGELLAYRESANRPDYSERVAAGIDESLRAGSVAVADIVTPETGTPETWPEPPSLWYIALRELIATRPHDSDAVIEVARRHLAAETPDRVQLGLSPHAPYSVHERLWDAAIEISRQHEVPLAVHLAESAEELEFLSSGSGPFAALLAARGSGDFVPAGQKPLDFLRRLADAPRVLIVHGNYLDAAAIDFLASHRQPFTIVYCPRTHAYFGHRDYPLERLLRAGVEVALGTDGRCSNPDLSIFAEMQEVAARHPQLPGEVILRMGTRAGARAVGLEQRLGSLEPGREASLTLVRLAETDDDDPYRLLFDERSRVVATLICGELVSAAEDLPSLR